MRRIVVALLVGVLVASVAYGLAASLDVISDDLGAGSDTVAACVDQVTVSYNIGFDDTANAYLVNSVDVNGIDATACNGEELSLVLTGDGTPAELFTGTTTVGGASVNVPVSPDVVTAEAVTGVHVAINGAATTP